ncbi:hypothetical protein [Streptomyces sp. MNP-20]|nr:hypothetical protein [Streptomyces sp. MNP-20]
MRMRYMTLEDATLAGASMLDLDQDLEGETDDAPDLFDQLFDHAQ